VRSVDALMMGGSVGVHARYEIKVVERSRLSSLRPSVSFIPSTMTAIPGFVMDGKPEGIAIIS